MCTEDNWHEVHACCRAQISVLSDLGLFSGFEEPEAIMSTGLGTRLVSGRVDDSDVKSNVSPILGHTNNDVGAFVGASEGLWWFDLGVESSTLAHICDN